MELKTQEVEDEVGCLFNTVPSGTDIPVVSPCGRLRARGQRSCTRGQREKLSVPEH